MKVLFIFMGLLALPFVLRTVQHNQPQRSISSVSQVTLSDSNQTLLSWYEKKSDNLKDWLKLRGEPGGPPDFIDFYFPEKDISINPSPAELKIAENAKILFNEYFPAEDPPSYVGTFFESGHPY